MSTSKKIVVEKEGILHWKWGDRDYGPLITSTDGKIFDPDDPWRNIKDGNDASDYNPIPEGSKVKVRIEITVGEPK